MREFATLAFATLGIELAWEGKGDQERGVDCKTGVVRVAVDPAYYRPTKVDLLLRDASKAKKLLGELCRGRRAHRAAPRVG